MGKDTRTPEHGSTRHAELAARERTAAVNGRHIPVRLPRARFTVDPDGHLTATVDDRPWRPSTGHPAKPADLGRVRLGRSDVLWARQQIANELGTPVLVEVVEDGRPYSDVIDPDDYRSEEPRDTTDASKAGVGPYTPGEPVSISVVVGQTHADEHGHVPYRLPAALSDRTVLVHGEASGTALPLDPAPRPERTAGPHVARSRPSPMGRGADTPRRRPGTGRATQPAEAGPAPVRRDAPEAGLGAL